MAFVLPLMVLVGVFGSPDAQGAANASQSAIRDIPPQILRLCMSGTEKHSPDIPWEVLCGVSSIESDHGRSPLPGIRSGVNSFGCCAGYVQFHVLVNGSPVYRLKANQTNASTWGQFSVDGNGDGWKVVHDPEDGYPSAARYLQHGTKQSSNDSCPGVNVGDYGDAVKRGIFGYNRACWYVKEVLEKAESYKAVVPAGGLPTGQLLMPGNLGSINSLGYVQLPPSGNGAYQIYACPGRRYGKPQLIAALVTVANRWKQLYPKGWLWIGDLNAAGHKSHKWGVAVDLSATTNGKDSVANYQKSNYNRRATVQLGILFLETGIAKNIWYDDVTVDSQLLRYAQDRKLKTELIMPQRPDHEDHMHWDINVPHGPVHMPDC